jgi:hypothetical protein
MRTRERNWWRRATEGMIRIAGVDRTDMRRTTLAGLGVRARPARRSSWGAVMAPLSGPSDDSKP